MKSYSKGKEFEEIIEKVYKLIAKNERKNVKIEKNVLMIGKNNTKNEIDILLSYESFGTIYRVAIECKNWKKTIDVKELRNFAFKLELIENINGIFISANSDFQIGAKKVTEYKQIKLIKFN
ncbi:restriction endonuclease, partial [Faecalibacillus faecis]|uniref:restriction endonuclease n=1 Tax=Faecalibacillus faecis TaxID=1982628 RepID=UPI003FD8A4A3